MVALAGVRADGYALYSLGIGGATHLSAGAASPETLQREAGGRLMPIMRTFVATGRMPTG